MHIKKKKNKMMLQISAGTTREACKLCFLRALCNVLYSGRHRKGKCCIPDEGETEPEATGGQEAQRTEENEVRT